LWLQDNTYRQAERVVDASRQGQACGGRSWVGQQQQATVHPKTTSRQKQLEGCRLLLWGLLLLLMLLPWCLQLLMELLLLLRV
jgi:hypothetical protein